LVTLPDEMMDLMFTVVGGEEHEAALRLLILSSSLLPNMAELEGRKYDTMRSSVVEK
jgi:hypothetical protein